MHLAAYLDRIALCVSRQFRHVVFNLNNKISYSVNGVQIIIKSLNDTCEVQLHDLIVVTIAVGMVQLIQQRERVVARFRIGYLDPENIASTCCAAIDDCITYIIEKHLAVLGVNIVSICRPDRFTVDSCLECIAAWLVGADAEQARYAAGRYRGLTVTVRVTVRQFVFVYGTDDGCVYGTRNVVNNRHIKT